MQWTVSTASKSVSTHNRKCILIATKRVGYRPGKQPVVTMHDLINQEERQASEQQKA